MNFAQRVHIGDRRLEHPFYKALRQLIIAGNLISLALETDDANAGHNALQVWEAAVKRIREVME